MSTISEIYATIQERKPSLIFLTGKTSTGKSTFANRLHDDLGYDIIELDQIVRQVVIQGFGFDDPGKVFVEVYRNSEKTEWIDAFVADARKRVARSATQGSPAIIEGALANAATLKRIVAGVPDFSFIYVHPEDTETYYGYLLARFMQAHAGHNANLPNGFWSSVDPADFERFCKDRVLTPPLEKALRAYAQSSKEESETRLAMFQESFSSMLIAVPGR